MEKSPLEQWVEDFIKTLEVKSDSQIEWELLEKLGEEFDKGRRCGLYEADQWWD